MNQNRRKRRRATGKKQIALCRLPFAFLSETKAALFLTLLLACWQGVSADPFTIRPRDQRPFRFSGYVKYLQTTTFPGNADDILTDNLLHHRLNFRWDIVEPLRVVAEVRNRIFWGETVKFANNLGLDFAELIDSTSNDIYDMSLIIADKKALAWQVVLDRAFLRYSKKWFELTAGRQRINWGVTLIWNPNDVFNAYSFYDFDYEERPGSDAVRLAFYPDSKSSVVVASKIAYKKEDVVSAVLYKWNIAKYDFQALAGVAHEDIVAGGGWAGNIGNAGFKGEFTYFHPYSFDTAGVFAGTISGDYSFKCELYLNGSFLYTSNGSNHADFRLLTNLNLSAKNLSPYKYSFLVNLVYPFTPIITGSLSTLYSPGEDHALFLNPVLTYNIRENWDIDVVSQIFLSKYSGKYEDVSELLYFRLRWSY